MSMKYYIKKYPGVTIEISCLSGRDEPKDFHLMVHADEIATTFGEQANAVRFALIPLIGSDLLKGAAVVFARCFLSDAANQQKPADELLSQFLCCPVSYIQQPPLDGSKIALWLHLQTGAVLNGSEGYSFERNGFTHYYTSDRGTEGDSYLQTLKLLEDYERRLSALNCRIENDCIRTWFFTRDIDTDYACLVKARKENFSQNGLTSETHYIASTGIEGRDGDACVKVKMDTYLIKGLEKGQLQFLYAKENMSPTHQYGVTFERGAYIDFGDRRNVYISGTASIDRHGRILFENDVILQTRRTLENVEVLLREADCGFCDLMQIIVYLRDIADYATVKQMFDEKFPQVPKVIVLAPICRTQWLTEMECIAAKPIQNNKFRNY